jgi:hypothetical protein
MRIDLLQALEADFNLTGIKKVWRYFPDPVSIPESSYPCIYVAFGTEKGIFSPEGTSLYEVPVVLVCFIKAPTDSKNEGLLRNEAESWLHKFKNVQFNNLKLVEEAVSIEYITGTPYLNDLPDNKAFLILEFNLTYKGE